MSPLPNRPPTTEMPFPISDRYRADVDARIWRRLQGKGDPARPLPFTAYQLGDLVDTSDYDMVERRPLVRPVKVTKVAQGTCSQSRCLVTMRDAVGRVLTLDAAWVRPLGKVAGAK